MTNDEKLMEHALLLAAKARGKTSPNPLVGAVVVKDGEIVGEGYHQKVGTPHAEVHALHAAGEKARGATIYVTLEPCSHFGRTPPCADAIAAAGITRVVAAMEDPNPKVSGKGFAKLREAGIDVKVGVLENEARQLNEIFLHYITTGLPFVTLKTAATLDGKIATSTGKSKWITGKAARTEVHALRAEHDAVLTGIGTILADNPELTVRYVENAKQPLRVVLDSQMQTPLNAKIVDASAETVIFSAASSSGDKKAKLIEKGIQVYNVSDENGFLSVEEVLSCLGKSGVTSVLIEAGPRLVTSFLQSGKVNKWYHFIAPKLFGQDGQTFYNLMGIDEPEEASAFFIHEIKNYAGDILLLLYPKRGDR